jgi:hypothetical protein
MDDPQSVVNMVVRRNFRHMEWIPRHDELWVHVFKILNVGGSGEDF